MDGFHERMDRSCELLASTLKPLHCPLSLAPYLHTLSSFSVRVWLLRHVPIIARLCIRLTAVLPHSRGGVMIPLFLGAFAAQGGERVKTNSLIYGWSESKQEETGRRINKYAKQVKKSVWQIPHSGQCIRCDIFLLECFWTFSRTLYSLNPQCCCVGMVKSCWLTVGKRKLCPGMCTNTVPLLVEYMPRDSCECLIGKYCTMGWHDIATTSKKMVQGAGGGVVGWGPTDNRNGEQTHQQHHRMMNKEMAFIH